MEVGDVVTLAVSAAGGPVLPPVAVRFLGYEDQPLLGRVAVFAYRHAPKGRPAEAREFWVPAPKG